MTNMTPSNPKKFLIIAPMGANPSCHKEWILGKRDFDLMLINYSDEPNRYKEDADYYFDRKGFKFEIIKDAIDAYFDIVQRYEVIWLPDVDLSISTETINKLFKLFCQYDLDMGQPAVGNKSIIHKIMERRKFCYLRYVNFVELMCPIFKREALIQVLDTFRLNRSGWGIDWIWAERLKGKRIAIIDATPVFHTKKIDYKNGLLYETMRKHNVDFTSELKNVKEKYGLKEKYVTFSYELTWWGKIFNRVLPREIGTLK